MQEAQILAGLNLNVAKRKSTREWLQCTFFPLRSCFKTFTFIAITIYIPVPSSVFNQGYGSLGSESVNKVSVLNKDKLSNLKQSTNKTGTERSMTAQEWEEPNQL